MNDEQLEQVKELVQEIADLRSTSFDDAFTGAMGVLRYHAIDCIPKGEGKAGGSTQES